MKINKLVPTKYIDIIKQSESIISDTITKERKDKAASTIKKLAYKEDKLIYLATYLYERSNTIYTSKKKYKGISQETLTEIIGFSNKKQTVMHINILVALGIVTITGKAKAGYASLDYICMPIDILNLTNYNDKTLFTKMSFEKKQIKKKNIGNELLIQAIYDSVEVDTSSEEYVKIMNELMENEKDNIAHLIHITDSFNKKAYSFEVANVNNRRMSIFSQCKREFRSLIKIDGKQTTKIDFANSQPAFLANYIMTEYIKYNRKVTEDIQLFYDLCITGKLYDYVGDKLFNGNREEAKDLWMKAGYGRMSILTVGDDLIDYNKDGLLFSTLFPNVIKFLDNKKANAEKYSELSTSLQSFEAKLVNKISDYLFEKGIINITIYDEFIVRIDQKELAIEIINEMIKEAGLIIVLKCDLDDSNESIIETDIVNQEIIKTSSEEPKTILFTKKDYEDLIEEKWYKAYSHRNYKLNRDKLLNELVELQLISTKQIKNKLEKLWQRNTVG